MASKPEKELGGTRQMSTSTKVIIIIFAIIMALSMMLPSLASVFASNNAAEQEEAAQADEADATTTDTSDSEESDDTDSEDSDADDSDADEDADADDAESDVPDNDTLKSLAEQYQDQVDTYEARLESDPSNLAALLNLGQIYMNWGYSATYSSSTDEETEYSNGLLDKAVEYFDRYLALNDSNAVKVDRALCEFYAGNTSEATEALEKITTDSPDYPLAWANLGLLYESQFDYDNASSAYRKAVETDADDEYGAKSYANQRLISLNSTVSSPGDAGDASADDISTAPESGLTSTLASDSGVGF